MNEYSEELVKAAIIAKIEMWDRKQKEAIAFFENNIDENRRIRGLDEIELEQEYLKCNDDQNPNFKSLYGLGGGLAVEYVLRRTIDGYQEHVEQRDSLPSLYKETMCRDILRTMNCVSNKVAILNKTILLDREEQEAVFGNEYTRKL